MAGEVKETAINRLARRMSNVGQHAFEPPSEAAVEQRFAACGEHAAIKVPVFSKRHQGLALYIIGIVLHGILIIGNAMLFCESDRWG